MLKDFSFGARLPCDKRQLLHFSAAFACLFSLICASFLTNPHTHRLTQHHRHMLIFSAVVQLNLRHLVPRVSLVMTPL